MAFFILELVGGILSGFDPNWSLLGPGRLLDISYDALFCLDLPTDVEPVLALLMALALTVPPLLVVFDRVHRKGVGK